MRPSNRIIELCERLTSVGHAPSKLSASEFHELADFVFDLEDKPTVVCLCGSTRFIETFAIKHWELEREGKIVLGCTLLPESYCKVADHFAEHTGCKEECDILHRRKIDMADEVMVLNVGGYIGESTRGEIAYAAELGKPVTYLEPLNVQSSGTRDQNA